MLPCVRLALPTVQKTAALVHHEQAHSTFDAKKWLHRLPPDAQQGRSSQAPGVAELSPYFDVWRSVRDVSGVLYILAVEHDAESVDVPLIIKGADGMARV